MERDADSVHKALKSLNQNIKERAAPSTLSFEEFLRLFKQYPDRHGRNVFQHFHDMLRAYMGEGYDEYPDDPESIHFLKYDTHRMFVEGSEHPFFADRLFANRLAKLSDSMLNTSQQNKIYIFRGPPGSGKSTFIYNILRQFQAYANSKKGQNFEILWRLDKKSFRRIPDMTAAGFLEKLYGGFQKNPSGESTITGLGNFPIAEKDGDYLEVPCPSHDHPLLIIPKQYRQAFLKEVFQDGPAYYRILSEKKYEWILKDDACTICTTLYEALMQELNRPEKVHKMIYASPYIFSRRKGEGVSVFSPGDAPVREPVMTNRELQQNMNSMLRTGRSIQYIYSHYAKTNNGIYALMDVKSHNKNRLIELHNIISEGIHKVENLEENVRSILFAVMNPEDQREFGDIKSFSDRIQYINIPYVLDINTEVEIYKNIFGKAIQDHFLPRVLHNFARIIISSRMKDNSEAMLEWIKYPSKYSLFCDSKLRLLKMEIYTGYIPNWLHEEDRKNLTAKLRRKIIAESEVEGDRGISGRDSINIFSNFFSTYAKDDKLVNMSALFQFFTNAKEELNKYISRDFLDSILKMYDYTVLQEVKESLYYYNKTRLSKDIQNYLFAVNYETGTRHNCHYTGETVEISEDFFRPIESWLIGSDSPSDKRLSFRSEIQKEYATKTLTQEILVEGKSITKTDIFDKLQQKYAYNIKEKALDPFLKNENFRRAIKDFGTKSFNSHDKKIKKDVRYLLRNLSQKYNYTEKGAKEICTYVIDNNLAQKFANKKNSGF